MNKNKSTNGTIIYNICITSILMSLTLSTYYLVNLLPLGAIGTFDIHLLFYIYGIILIKKRSFKLFFFFTIPFLSIFNTNILGVNLIQIFVEYFLVYYCFWIFLFFDFKFIRKNKITEYAFFVFGILLSFSLRLTLHIVSGLIWWNAPNILTSFLINIKMLILDWIFIIPFSFVTIPLILSFEKYYK